jgi:FkbM family methyltransferase
MKNKFIILYLEFLKILLRKRVRPVKIINGKLKGLRWGFSADTNNEYILGNFESNLQNIMNAYIGPDNIVYDIGAHYGYFTLFASRLVGNLGRVYAFEPMPKNFQRLAYNIKINKPNNIKLYNYAISDKETVLNFSDSKNTVANTYIASSPLFSQPIPIIEIKSISLDILFSRKEILPPQFIKIDTEGAEYDILVGAQNIIEQFKPAINLSTHENHNPGVTEKCLTLLERYGYKIIHRLSNQDNNQMQEFFLTT